MLHGFAIYYLNQPFYVSFRLLSSNHFFRSQKHKIILINFFFSFFFFRIDIENPLKSFKFPTNSKNLSIWTQPQNYTNNLKFLIKSKNNWFKNP